MGSKTEFLFIVLGVGATKDAGKVPCVIAASADIASSRRALSSTTNDWSMGHDSRRMRSKEKIPSSFGSFVSPPARPD
jgi:hypothetical protein